MMYVRYISVKIYDEDYGFDIKFDYKRGEDYYLEIAIDNQKKKNKNQ